MLAAEKLSDSLRHPALARSIHYLERGIQLCLILTAVLFFISALIYLSFGHWTVTHKDFWRLDDILLNQPWPASSLAKFNNHSLFFPDLIFLADLLLFHGSQQLLFLVGVTLLFLSAALLLVPFWRDQRLNLTAKLAVTLILISGNFWMGRANIITSGGFTCAHCLCLIGTLLAFLYLPAMAHSSSPKVAMIVLMGAFLSSFSLATGLATWPTLLLLGWCLRLPRRALLILAVGTVVTAIIFAVLPSPLPLIIASANGTSSSPMARLMIVCRLLGVPVVTAARSWTADQGAYGAIENSYFALFFGAAGLVATTWLVVTKFFRRDLQRGGLEYIGVALVAANACIMLMIAFGRASLLQMIPGEVAAPRYYFWTTLFWSGLLMVILERCRGRRWRVFVLSLGIVALTIFILPKHRDEGEHSRYASLLAETAALSLVNNVTAPEDVKILFRDPEQVYRLVPQLRRRRLDMFANGWQNLAGNAADQLSFANQPSLENAAYHVAALLQQDSGHISARLEGTLNSTSPPHPPFLLVLDRKGIIRGLGRSFTIPSLIDWLLYEGKFPGTSFTCYIRDYAPGESYVIRGMDHKEVSRLMIKDGDNVSRHTLTHR